MSPSWRRPSRSSIIASSADAAEANKRRGHFHTAAIVYYTYMHILYRQTCLSLSDRGQSCLPQDNQERALLPGHFAVVVAALDPSRLSRELEVTLYTVDWGMRGPTS